MTSEPHELGPFAPPADYAFEPELQEAVPRPIPPLVRQGEFIRNRRFAQAVLLTIAVICLALARLPFIQSLGMYILPLQYLQWIALAFAGFWAASKLQAAFSLGPLRYVRDGLPLVARVVGLVKTPSIKSEGQITHYAFIAAVEFADPETGELKRLEAKSSSIPASKKDVYTTSFRVGDYVTAILFPGDPKSLQLYGFLGLNPDIGLVSRDPQSKQYSLWKVPLAGAVVCGFLGILLWNVYAYGYYSPLEFEFRNAAWPLGIGGLMGGIGLLLVATLNRRSGQRKLADRNAEALARGEAVELSEAASEPSRAARWGGAAIVFAGACLLSGLTVLCWCYTLNALLDRSPATRKPVQVKNLKMVTHKLIFREYVVEYVIPPSTEVQKLNTSPEHIHQFETDLAIAEIHAGRFGWPWVKTLHPVSEKALKTLLEKLKAAEPIPPPAQEAAGK